jgi:tetratricopeptide (TPR) repeat protein
MVRPLLLSAFIVTAFAGAQAQEMSAYYPGDGNVVTTPAQLHQVAPPDKSKSAKELEETADRLRTEKNYPDALDYLSAALEKDPKSARLYNKRGMVKVMMMMLADAKKDFEKSVKLDKKFAEAENNLGAMLYYKDRKYGSAIKHYRKAIEIDQRANFYSNLGTAYFAKKDYDKAENAYRTALQLDPSVFERQNSRTAVQLTASTVEERARHDYVIAKMFAITGDSDKCLLYLKKAMEDGFPVAEKIQKDKEFAGLRNDPRVKELLATIKPVTPY